MKNGKLKLIKRREVIMLWPILLLLITAVTGCVYEDFRVDYPYSSVYFANQTLKRNFVEDEVNTIKIGVMLGGKRENATDERVQFSVDDQTGLETTPYTQLPDKYYSLSSNNEMIIHSGSFIGEIEMEIAPSFYNDSLAYGSNYALIFKLEDTSADSILSSKDSLLLVIGFESRFFGNYYHNGRTIRKNKVDGSIVDTVYYHQEEPVTNDINIWPLITKGSKTVYSRGIAYYAPSDLTGFFIRVEDDYSLKIMEDPKLVSIGYNWKLKQADGANLYNPEKKMLILNYEFVDFLKGFHCYTTDTLLFRNRILDGVNQWDF